jgi:hypothetical protein
VVGSVSGGFSSFAKVIWFDHGISFESSDDFKAGLEDKNVLGRYKQAQEYLRKAKETYEAIMVSKHRIVYARRDNELTLVPLQLIMGLYYQ